MHFGGIGSELENVAQLNISYQKISAIWFIAMSPSCVCVCGAAWGKAQRLRRVSRTILIFCAGTRNIFYKCFWSFVSNKPFRKTSPFLSGLCQKGAPFDQTKKKLKKSRDSEGAANRQLTHRLHFLLSK